MPSLSDFQDDKSVVNSTILSQKSDLGAYRTSASASDEPNLTMTTYSLSESMQGMALYKPAGATYDVFNRDLSQELGDMGVEARWQTRQDKLTPYDVFVKDPDPSTLGDLDVGSSTGQAPGPGTVGAPPPITGGSADAFVCGDSVTVGCEAPLKADNRGWNFTIDARTSRPPDEGLDHIRSRNGNFGSLVVVNLGTNPSPRQPAQWIGDIMNLLTNVQRVCWVTCNECRGWIGAVNAELHNLKNRDPKVVLVDWQATISGNRSLIGGDGVHPTAEGYKVLSKMILDTVGPAPR